MLPTTYYFDKNTLLFKMSNIFLILFNNKRGSGYPMYPQILFQETWHKNPIKLEDRHDFLATASTPIKIFCQKASRPPPPPWSFNFWASMEKVHKHVGLMLKLVIKNKRMISQSQPKPNKITKIWTNAKTIQLQFALQSLFICFPIVLLLLPLWCWKRKRM